VVGQSEYFADDVLRALIRPTEKRGNLREALGLRRELTAYLGEFWPSSCTTSWPAAGGVLRELDQDSQAAILLGNQAADLGCRPSRRSSPRASAPCWKIGPWRPR